MIYIGADHRGFELKEKIKEWLVGEGYEVEDVGNHIFDPEDDYVDPAVKVAEMVEGSASAGGYGETRGGDFGILLCGSGHGVDIVANRFPGIRAIIGFNTEVSVQGREHEDANVLVIPANWVNEEEATERIRAFLQSEPVNIPRYERRRNRIENLRAK